MWTQAEGVALVESPGLRGRLDWCHPHRGLSDIQVLGGRGAWLRVPVSHLLQVQLPGQSGAAPPILDQYVRQSDLVVTYAAVIQGDVQSQVYWRVADTAVGDACGIETIVSVQTERLDSEPVSGTSSDISFDEIWLLDSQGVMQRCDLGLSSPRGYTVQARRGLFLFRLPGSELSYLEMVHTSDLAEARIVLVDDTTRAARSCFRLFAERLEKGVIRRGRVRGLFVPRDGDTSLATLLYQEFIDSAPPLTA